jgi:hypothetical protein
LEPLLRDVASLGSFDSGEVRRGVPGRTQRGGSFLLTEYTYRLAAKIRSLHQRTHPNQAAQDRFVRPEAAMGLVADLSELVVVVGLDKY